MEVFEFQIVCIRNKANMKTERKYQNQQSQKIVLDVTVDVLEAVIDENMWKRCSENFKKS